MSRSGFTLQRLQQDSLEAPGVTPLPPVSQGANIANQVREALAAAGQAVSMIGRQQRIASAEEDAENIGIARLEADKRLSFLADDLLKTIRSEVAAGNADALADESLSGMVEKRVADVLGEVGLNEAGQEAFRARTVAQLNGVATAARRALVEEANVERVVNIASQFIGVESADDYGRIRDSLMAADPSLTKLDIDRLAFDSFKAAATTGNRDVFDIIAAELPDSPDKRIQAKAIAQQERLAENESQQSALDAATDAVDVAIRGGDFFAAEAIAKSANIREKYRGDLLTTINVARESQDRELTSKARTDFNNEVYDALVNGQDVGDIVEKYVGLAFEPGDIPTIAAQVQRHNSEKMVGELAQLQSAVAAASAKPNDPNTPTIIAESVSQIGLLANAAERMHTAYTANPDALNGLPTEQFMRIVGAQADIVLNLEDARQRRETLTNLIDSGARAVDTVTVGGKNYTAKEQLDQKYDLIWDGIQQKFPTFDEQVVALATEISNDLNNRTYESSILTADFSQMLSLASAVANDPTPENMASLSAVMGRYGAVKNVNEGVAIRHMDDQSRDLMEGISLAFDVWGNNDLLAVQAGIKGLLGPDVPDQIRSSKYRKIAKDTVSAIDGIKEGQDGYDQVYDYATRQIGLMHAMGIGTDRAAAHVKRVLERDWMFYRGQAIRFRSADDKVQYDIPVLDRAVRQVYDSLPDNEKVWDADDLVLKPNEQSGRWMLHSVTSGSPIQWPPGGFDANEMLEIQGVAQQFNADAAREFSDISVEMQRGSRAEDVLNTGLLRKVSRVQPEARVAASVLEGLYNRIGNSTLRKTLKERADIDGRNLADTLRRKNDRLGRFQAAVLEQYRGSGKRDPNRLGRLDPLGMVAGGGF